MRVLEGVLRENEVLRAEALEKTLGSDSDQPRRNSDVGGSNSDAERRANDAARKTADLQVELDNVRI